MRRPRFCVDLFTSPGSTALACAALGWAMFGCTPSVPPPEEPTPSSVPSEPVASAPAAEDVETPEAPPASPPTSVEPEFTPGMTVRQAIDAAVHTERVEIEQEVLAEPIVKPELYEPCKLRGNQHFTLRVAIWDGRVVGMDLTTTPKSPSAEECIRTQVQGVTWKKKAKALSTFEFNF